MTLLPLNLGVGHFTDAEKRSPPDKILAQKILRRDSYTCRFCGFYSEKFQRVIPFVADQDKAGYVTSCTFCEHALDLERGQVSGVGVLIWLPEIEQAQLNHIMRAIYIARAQDEPLAEKANALLDILIARRSEVKKRLGSDDPILLAAAMCESLSLKEYQERGPKLDGIRLIAAEKHIVRMGQTDVDQFDKMVRYWISKTGPFAGLLPETWADLFKRAEATMAQT